MSRNGQNHMKVLVVDDEAGLRLMLVTYLERLSLIHI